MKYLIICLASLIIRLPGALAAQSLAGGQGAVADAAAQVVLAPGDAIRITVWRNPELSGDFIVAPDGSITHPLYREIKVAGVPLATVEDRVRAFLSRYETTPAFVVLPMIRVVVGGEVRQPNIISVPVGTSVVEAIAHAGGPTERGKIERVQVLRDAGSLTLDLRRPDALASRTLVRSGDQIIIPRARNIMQDVVIPSSSVLAAAAAITTIILQLRR